MPFLRPHSQTAHRRYYSHVAADQTTAVVQDYLHQLAEMSCNAAVEPIVRDLLASSVNRLHGLCTAMLFRSYPRLTQPPLNLQPEELLSSVVERMLKAMREIRPETVRQFFGLANQHMRWELNDLARRLDTQARTNGDGINCRAPPTSGSQLSPNAAAFWKQSKFSLRMSERFSVF